MPLSESQLSSIISALENDFDEYVRRMQVRRALIDVLARVNGNMNIGTNIPKPFDKSMMIIQTVTGHVAEGVQHYAARISANPPQPIIPRIETRSRVAKSVEKTASEQERLLSALWQNARGPQKQYQVAWSQSWCRVGWYLTLPRDIGFGLPDREYFEDLDDDDIERMQNAGTLSYEKDERGRAMESGENWIKRRREKAEEDAIAGKSLFTLEAIPGDMVRYRMDRDGVKYAYVCEEVPASDFGAGTDFSKQLARRLGIPEGDVDQFGIFMNKEGKIVAGATAGGEFDSTTAGANFTFIRFFDRDCVYYLVAGPGKPSGGKLLWHGYHGGGAVPLIPAPGIWTDSRRPGGEFSSPMESVFALAPLLNQVETLLSNAAAFNAIPRWVIEKADGSLVVDEQGNPKEIAAAPTPGLDPAEAQVVEGKLRQLVIDAELLFKLLQVYAQQMEAAMPPDVARGEGGTSGAAWAIRQLLSAAQADLEQPVSNHASAVRDIFQLWVRWMRLLDVPVYCLSVPKPSAGVRSVRGLIEFDPEDLVEGFEVVQSKDSASDRIVLQQHGLELYQKAQVIDARRYFEEYAHEQDPVQAEKDMWAERAVQIVMGIGPPAPQGSVLAQIVKMAQGRAFLAAQEKFPNSAILLAELLAEQAAMSMNPAEQGMTVSNQPSNMQPGAGSGSYGNVAEANGMRQPGLGSSVSLPGSPEMGINAMMGRQ